MYDRLTEMELQELFYGLLISLCPVDSAHGPDWHEAECECGWSTTGAQRVARDAAYDHIADVHMLGWRDVIFAVGDRLRNALMIMPLGRMDCDGGHECACDWHAVEKASELIEKHTRREASPA